MQLKTIALATAFALTSSLAFAQAGYSGSSATAIGSSADTGNGAMINRGPNPTAGMDRDNQFYQSGRSLYPSVPDRWRNGPVRNSRD
jgi:hypothetical protein